MKEKICILSGNALAAFMDFGIGTAMASLVAYSYGMSLPWYLVFLGGILSLVPDFDLVPSVLLGVSPAFDHRQTPFHRPLLVLPIVIVFAYFLGGDMWALIAGVCVFGHYIYDTNFVGTDYGIAWFWPFSMRYWSVFGSFVPAVLEKGSHHEWLRHNWLRPSFLSIREIGIGLAGVSIALWFMATPPLLIVIMVLLAILCVNSLWIVVRRFPL